MRETEFYVGRSFPAESRGFDWIAPDEILRKDTGEPVKHLRGTGQSHSSAADRVNEAVENEMTRLGRPKDWGRDATVPEMIRSYLSAKERILEQTRENAPDESADHFNTEYDRLHEQLKIDFGHQVSVLTPDQQIELMTLTDREQENPVDTWIVDEDIARFWLYSLIEDPRPAARRAWESGRRIISIC